MAIFFGYKRLASIEDWRGLAGEDTWVRGRSAFELAHAGQPAGGLPARVHDALEHGGQQHLRDLAVDLV